MCNSFFLSDSTFFLHFQTGTVDDQPRRTQALLLVAEYDRYWAFFFDEGRQGEFNEGLGDQVYQQVLTICEGRGKMVTTDVLSPDGLW